ncbi:MAG: serine/arginine repetitive matrix protein 2, partial [Nocardioidaceae bacterium]|nr:serine/arginine repetitive matrix protein 2 [Nocardioidaceae bacterium]
PWAVVTRAVQVSLVAEERAAGLLCSTAQARRRETRDRHDARRFSEYETDVVEFHPVFRTAAAPDGIGDDEPAADAGGSRLTTVAEAADRLIALFVALGWADNTVTCAVDYICSRLMESRNRAAAHSLLRRDQVGRAFLDLDRSSWSTLLRLVLGNPEPGQRGTRAGHGLLALFLCGHPVAEFLADDALVREISESAPAIARRASA